MTVWLAEVRRVCRIVLTVERDWGEGPAPQRIEPFAVALPENVGVVPHVPRNYPNETLGAGEWGRGRREKMSVDRTRVSERGPQAVGHSG